MAEEGKPPKFSWRRLKASITRTALEKVQQASEICKLSHDRNLALAGRVMGWLANKLAERKGRKRVRPPEE
jgi:hypothetical protein